MSAPQPERSTGLLVIAGQIDDGDVQTLCERLRAVIDSSDAAVVVCDVQALPANTRTIEALARLQLTARRCNRWIRLQRASPELEQLLVFAGLADVLPLAQALRDGRRRHAEEREHARRVEERVDRDDPPV